MSSFEIPDGPANVKLAPGAAPQDPQTGSAVYGVTNKSTAPVAGRIAIQVTGDAKSEWFTVEGDRERSFAPGETQTVTVSIAVPPGAPAGAHKFRLRVVAVNDPDNDHMESPIGTVMVAPPAGPKPDTGFPWWIVVVGVVVLAVVVFLVTAFVWPGFLKSGPDPVPVDTPAALPPFNETDLKDKPREFAEGFLGALGYHPTSRAAPAATGLAPGHVVSAAVSTAAGDAPGTVVIVYDPGVPLPDFVGKTPAEAAGKASGKVSLRYCKPRLAPNPVTGRVTAQSPRYPAQVALNTDVRLTLSTTDDIPVCRTLIGEMGVAGVDRTTLRADGVRFAYSYKTQP